jgi:hypothetical protein
VPKPPLQGHIAFSEPGNVVPPPVREIARVCERHCSKFLYIDRSRTRTSFPKGDTVKDKKPVSNHESDSVKEFCNKSDAVRERIEAIKRRITEIDNSLLDKRTNRGAIRAVDRDPEKEIKALESEKKDLDRQLQLANQEIQTIFPEEQKRLLASIADGWKRNHESVSGPRKIQMEMSVTRIKGILESMVNSDDSSQAAAAKKLDDEVDAFNKRCSEFRVGYKIPEASKLGTLIASDNTADANKIMKEISRLAEEFRKSMEAEWKRKNPDKAKLLAESQRG